MQSSAPTIQIPGQSLRALIETPLFAAFQKTLCPTGTCCKDNISISASQHVLLLSFCGKQGALIILKLMLPIYKSSFQRSTCQSSSHGGRGWKTVDFRPKAEDSCILGCNDGFLVSWGLLQHFRRVAVLYFVPGNTERGFTPHTELPQRQKSWGEIILSNSDQMYSALQVACTVNSSTTQTEKSCLWLFIHHSECS